MEIIDRQRRSDQGHHVWQFAFGVTFALLARVVALG